MLLNLVANAIKFSQSGGKVTVSVKILESEDDLSVADPKLELIIKTGASKENKFLEVQVEDSGIGIKPEDQTKLFKMFGFLNKDEEVNTKGIGLGLNICKKITNMFDGDIICRSQEGIGTNFVFIVALGNQMDNSCSGRRQ